MGLKSWLTATFCVVALAGATGATALAGEITGNGKPLWTNTDQWGVEHTLHANSICAFSGQQDTQFPGTPTNPNPDYDPNSGHAQSWGQIPKEVRDFLATQGAAPGDSCNGHTGFLASGTGE